MENLEQIDELSPLLESAIRMNEVYRSLVAGGFTSEDALTLIAKLTKKSD
jgi:hypothetical protein